jgi:hypothetical protein
MFINVNVYQVCSGMNTSDLTLIVTRESINQLARKAMGNRKIICVGLTLVLSFLATPAMAQYVWRDEKGVMQLSDRPPPPSVPLSRILKTPGKTTRTPDHDVEDISSNRGDVVRAAPATTADREADFQQRRKAAAVAENKAAGEARDQAQQAANCNAARQNQRALDGGGAIVSYDDNGERSVMNDLQRGELAKNTQKVLSSCK